MVFQVSFGLSNQRIEVGCDCVVGSKISVGEILRNTVTLQRLSIHIQEFLFNAKVVVSYGQHG